MCSPTELKRSIFGPSSHKEEDEEEMSDRNDNIDYLKFGRRETGVQISVWIYKVEFVLAENQTLVMSQERGQRSLNMLIVHVNKTC